MEKYYLIYTLYDEPIFITTNLELAEKEYEQFGRNYIELPFHV